MSVLFIQYPKCSTCRNAAKWLQERGISYEDRHIKENPPTKEELGKWHAKSGMDIKRFFNTSGLVYKDLKLKDKLSDMTLEEKLEVLSTDGMLVKRPLVIGEDFVLTGFKPQEWEEKMGL